MSRLLTIAQVCDKLGEISADTFDKHYRYAKDFPPERIGKRWNDVEIDEWLLSPASLASPRARRARSSSKSAATLSRGARSSSRVP